ncbi:hypothetical protein AYX14_05333 [Cryptococcus neoformans]|nr:hypothetical protein AYX15_04710 [Cryptococcus neoformans var. grubii]OWZ69133.1 hypothetical protein AYX14_05333 [Cryptococcus neoformans var. grubii]
MSVAVSAPIPLATRPTIMSKPSAPRIQSRPSPSSTPSSSTRPMAAKPARQPPNSAASSSSTSKVAAKSVTPNIPTSARPSPAPRANSSSSSSIVAVTPILGKDTSSSAGRIFAKPSKEWVLPERAKPGRKVSNDEPDNKRQSQNRLSQRAHRARRTDYIQTLEERLRQYEADEIHSNVRLQEVARALKADNERLKAEVNELKNKCMEYNGEKDIWEMERRTLKEAVRDMRMEIEALRARYGMETIVKMDIDQSTIDSLVPGPSIPRRQSGNRLSPGVANRPGNVTLQDCPICPNPDPDCPCQRPHACQQQYPPEHLTLAPSAAEDHAAACGLCHSKDECLCRAVDEDVKPDISSPSHDLKTLDDDRCGLCTGGDFCACREAAAASVRTSVSSDTKTTVATTTAVSGIVTASASSIALPLRLRTKGNRSTKASIWSLNAAPSVSREAVCTGDPSNCDACRDDSFGREFCQHLFEAAESSSSVKPCSSCPGNCMNVKADLSPSPGVTQASSSSSNQIRTPPTPPVKQPSTVEDDDTPLAPLQMLCCGNPELCGGSRGGGCTGDVIGIGGPPAALQVSLSFPTVPEVDEDDNATLRPDQAWKQLKAHPNAKFASLALLADVVARRTKCLGPRVEMSPMPASPAPTASAPTPIPIAAHSASPRSRQPMLGSSDIPNTQQKRRNIEVETSAVRDALKLLDEATPAPSPEPDRESKRRRIERIP